MHRQTFTVRLLSAICALLSLVPAQEARWFRPNEADGDFSETYTNGVAITFEWQALNASETPADLWIVSYNPRTNGFAQLIQMDLGISQSDSFRWTISVTPGMLEEDDRFRLVFVPWGIPYYSGLPTQIQSPAFMVVSKSQGDSVGAASTSSVSSATLPSNFVTMGASATASASASATADLPLAATTSKGAVPSSGKLSGGTIAGIVIGSAVAVAILIGVGILIGWRKSGLNNQGRLRDEKLDPSGESLSYNEHKTSTDGQLSIMTTPAANAQAPRYEADSGAKSPVELATWSMRESTTASQEMADSPTISQPSGPFSPTSPQRVNSMQDR